MNANPAQDTPTTLNPYPGPVAIKTNADIPKTMLVTIENRIRFEINQAAAERAGLKISSKLLSLGRVVRT